MAAVLAALRLCDASLVDQRIVVFGAGAAGMGIVELLRAAMRLNGLTDEDAARRIWGVDRQGLLLSDQPGLTEAQQKIACPPADVSGWLLRNRNEASLLDVIHHVRPTVLIGTSGQPGAFTEECVKAMAAHTRRPIILPLSNPASRCEADPCDIMKWTDRRALVGSGSPATDMDYAQVNNVHVFPGLGLGALMADASTVSVNMVLAAARALAGQAYEYGTIMPPIAVLRTTAMIVARAVADRGHEEGHGGCGGPPAAPAPWKPRYP